MLRIVACQSPSPSSKPDARAKAEKARTVRVKHISHDLQRIAKQEVEFSKALLKDVIPFRIEWNESAMPFTIKKKEEKKGGALVPDDFFDDTDVDWFT